MGQTRRLAIQSGKRGKSARFASERSAGHVTTGAIDSTLKPLASSALAAPRCVWW